MNIHVRNCLNKLSIVVKSKGSNMVDNTAFCSSLSELCFSKMYKGSKEPEPPNAMSYIRFNLYVNKLNNDFLKDVTLFTLPNFKISMNDPGRNLSSYRPISLEIKEDAFNKYSVDELFALIMNSVTQNVITTTTSSRALELINYVFETGSDKRINTFNASLFMVSLLNYLNIHVYETVIVDSSALTAHQIMIDLNIDETYNDILDRQKKGMKSLMKVIEDQHKEDIQQVKSIVKYTYMNQENFRVFLDNLMSIYPYIGLQQCINNAINDFKFMTNTQNTILLEELLYPMIDPAEISNEGFFGFGESKYTQRKYRFKVDSILIMIQNMETNDEKQYIRNQIFKLEKELADHKEKREEQVASAKTPEVVAYYKLQYDGLDMLIAEISVIRDRLVKMKPVPKKIGLYVEYPAGWEG